MNTTNTNINKTREPIDLHSKTVLGEPIDNIIFFLSLVLPFINEIAIVLRKSGLPMFHNLYKTCVHSEILLLLSESCKKNKKIHCTTKDTIQGLLIDALAYLGILLNISRNTIKYGYITGVINGFILIIFSIIIPNLYLAHIIHNTKQFLNTESAIITIIIGIMCIALLIIITKIIQELISEKFKNYRIDIKNEPVIKNKTQQEIINYLD